MTDNRRQKARKWLEDFLLEQKIRPKLQEEIIEFVLDGRANDSNQPTERLEEFIRIRKILESLEGYKIETALLENLYPYILEGRDPEKRDTRITEALEIANIFRAKKVERKYYQGYVHFIRFGNGTIKGRKSRLALLITTIEEYTSKKVVMTSGKKEFKGRVESIEPLPEKEIKKSLKSLEDKILSSPFWAYVQWDNNTFSRVPIYRLALEEDDL